MHATLFWYTVVLIRSGPHSLLPMIENARQANPCEFEWCDVTLAAREVFLGSGHQSDTLIAARSFGEHPLRRFREVVGKLLFVKRVRSARSQPVVDRRSDPLLAT